MTKQTKAKRARMAIEDIVALHEQGLSPTEIAARLNTNYGNVYARLRRAGLVPHNAPPVAMAKNPRVKKQEVKKIEKLAGVKETEKPAEVKKVGEPAGVKKVEEPAGVKEIEKPGIKEAVDKAEKAATEEEFSRDFAQGYERGFKTGVGSRLDIKSIQRIAYDDGVRHIVTLAENLLVKELGLPSREALAKSGKIPGWWIATLVTNFAESPKEEGHGTRES